MSDEIEIITRAHLPRVTHWTPDMPFLGLTVEAGVLDDGTCILSQKSALALLGISRGRGRDRLAGFASSGTLTPFAAKYFPDGTDFTVPFVPVHGGKTANGLPARAFLDICRAVRDAHFAGALRANQVHVARQVGAILSAAEDVGFEQMIKNAAGYVSAQGQVADEFHDRLEEAAERESRALPAPEPQPPALADPVVRRLEAEADLERARAERIRQERLENARKDRAAMRRAQQRANRKAVVTHPPEPVTTKALPPPVPPAPPPTPALPNDIDRARSKRKRTEAVEGQGELQYGPPLPRTPKPTPVPTGRHPGAHTVSGHWTNQRWGPGRCYIKRIWIEEFPRGGREPTPRPTAGSEAG